MIFSNNIGKCILFIALVLSSYTAFAQLETAAEKKGIEVYGNVIDSLSKEPISYAIVRVLGYKSDKLIGGATTSEDGTFKIEGLNAGKYSVEISFIGYKTKTINAIELKKDKNTYRLKDVAIASSANKMDEVVVMGGVPKVTYEIDKKVVNVEDMQNTAGQTAIEVLENIPSIVVSPDGTVSLRGSSSFTLLIDGVPTVLEHSDALAQIPASSIQDIEIITNPSAKFNAEGTAGVINIITKKSKLKGTSSLVNLTAGSYDNYNANGALSIKREKVAFDVNANYMQRYNPSDKIEKRRTVYDTLVNDLNATGFGGGKRNGWGTDLGFQWTPNTKHKIIAKTEYSNRYMKFFNQRDYESFNNGDLIQSFFTDDRVEVDMSSSSSNLVYQYNIDGDRNHYLRLGAIANLRWVDQADSSLSYSNNKLIRGNVYTEVGPSDLYRFDVDYKRPIKERFNFETGLQAQFGRSFDDGDNFQLNNITSEYERQALFSSDVNYVRDVHAGYALLGGQLKKFGFQTGLRAEYTHRAVTSDNFPDATTINRLDLFPSTHFSYSFKNESQVLLSYSRRIERPRSWYFEPFVTWQTPYSVRGGNPNLNPTYITVIDFSYMYPLKQLGFWSIEAYYRRSNGDIRWVQTVYQPEVLISQPYNVGIGQNTGIEAAVNYKLTKWYQLNVGFNTYYFDLNSDIKGVNLSANSFNYNINLRNSFIVKGWSLQLNGRLRSGSVEPQGKSLWNAVADVSLKKSFYRNRLTFNLNTRNVFVTDRDINYVYTENVSIYDASIQRGPMVMFTVSLKLNNYEKLLNAKELDDF